MKKLRLLELFSGIGAQHKALTRLGIDCACTQCDNDIYAVKAYNAIHGDTPNIGDITKIDESTLQKDQWDLMMKILIRLKKLEFLIVDVIKLLEIQ